MANDLISDDWVTFTPSQPTSNDGMLAYVGQTLLASPLMTARGHNPRPTNIFIVIVAPSHSRSLTRPRGNRTERAPLRNGFKLTSAPPIKSNGCRFKLEWFNDYFRCWRLNRVSKQWKASEILFEQKKKRKKKRAKKGRSVGRFDSIEISGTSSNRAGRSQWNGPGGVRHCQVKSIEWKRKWRQPAATQKFFLFINKIIWIKRNKTAITSTAHVQQR